MNNTDVDVLFIPYYYDLDRWHNDDLIGEETKQRKTPQPREALSHKSRMIRESVSIDDKRLDFSRFLSWAKYNTTAEYERYDSFSLTLLSGSYYMSFLRKRGYSVTVANAVNRITLDRLKEKCTPRFILISTTLILEHMVIRDFIGHLRRLWPSACIIAGGLFLVELKNTTAPSAFLDVLRIYGADAYVVSPYGEQALLSILDKRSRQELLQSAVPPCTFILDGKTVREPKSIVEEPLSMEDHYIHWNDYVTPDHLYHTIHTRTARSCAFHCAYCNFPINQGPLSLMDLEAVDEELRQLARLRKVNSIIFTDDTFNVPLPRFKKLCRLLEGYEFAWYSFFRPQYADEETAKLMVGSGCKAVFMGIESADNHILKIMNKKTTIEAMGRGIEILKKHEITCHANFVVGFPGETEGSASKIIPFLNSTGVDFFTLVPWSFVPSTPIGKRKKEFCIQGAFENWEHSTMNSQQANELIDRLAQLPCSAVQVAELAANNFWSEIMLLCNGFSPKEAQTCFQIYNNLAGENFTKDQIKSHPLYDEFMTALNSHEMPRPVNF